MLIDIEWETESTISTASSVLPQISINGQGHATGRDFKPSARRDITIEPQVTPYREQENSGRQGFFQPSVERYSSPTTQGIHHFARQKNLGRQGIPSNFQLSPTRKPQHAAEGKPEYQQGDNFGRSSDRLSPRAPNVACGK